MLLKYLLTYSSVKISFVTFCVGEELLDVPSPLVHAAIVSEAVPLTSKDLLSVLLASKVLGGQPGIEYSSIQPSSKLFKEASSALSTDNFAVCILPVPCFSLYGVSFQSEVCFLA